MQYTGLALRLSSFQCPAFSTVKLAWVAGLGCAFRWLGFFRWPGVLGLADAAAPLP